MSSKFSRFKPLPSDSASVSSLDPDFLAAVGELESVGRIKLGSVVQGRITSEGAEGFLVDIGGKRDVLLRYEWSAENSALGDFVRALVVVEDQENAQAEISSAHWKSGKARVERRIISGGRVVGLIVDYISLECFLPVSELSAPLLRSIPEIGQELLISVLHGTVPRGDCIVVSNKQAISEIQQSALSLLKVGDRVEARVKVIPKIDTGVVVDFTVSGGAATVELTGFIRRKEVVDAGDRKCSDVLSPGEFIECQVAEIDKASRKVFLAYRTPFTRGYIEKLKVGEIVDGLVVELVQFGAFVRLSSCVTALLHIRHIEKQDGKFPTFSPGQEIKAKIVDLDRRRQRIGLGTKGLSPSVAVAKPSPVPLANTVAKRWQDAQSLEILRCLVEDALLYYSCRVKASARLGANFQDCVLSNLPNEITWTLKSVAMSLRSKKSAGEKKFFGLLTESSLAVLLNFSASEFWFWSLISCCLKEKGAKLPVTQGQIESAQKQLCKEIEARARELGLPSPVESLESLSPRQVHLMYSLGWVYLQRVDHSECRCVDSEGLSFQLKLNPVFANDLILEIKEPELLKWAIQNLHRELEPSVSDEKCLIHGRDRSEPQSTD